MIDIQLLQTYINKYPNKVEILKKAPYRGKINTYQSFTIEEMINGNDPESIICQVLTTDGITDHERLAIIDRSEFFSWVRDNKINTILDENLG
jgi:hypothetical protein